MRGTTWAAAVVTVGAFAALAGCGGATSTTWESGSGGGSFTFEGALVAQPAALVTADVDGDGLADLVASDRAGVAAPKCWHNLGGGSYVDASASWAASPVVAGVQGACGASADAGLLADLGVHLLPGGATGEAPYVVMHVGDGVAAPAGPPVASSIEPASGPSGSLAWIEGTDLAAVKEPPSVEIGGVAADVLIAFPDYVLVVVPAGLPLGPTSVVLTRGGTTAAPLAFEVTAAPAPVLVSVEPTTVAPGTVAILHGTDLGSPFDEVVVTFSGTPAEHAFAFGEVAFALVPDGAVSGPVVITVNGVASDPVFVTVGALPAPAITALAPASASVGSLVKIDGTDLFVLGEPVEVSFGGVGAAVFSFDGASVTAVVPPGAADGDVVVTVGGRASAGVAFDVVARGAPHVTGVSPSPVSVGDELEIAGTDLVDLSAWSVGGLPPFPSIFGDLHVTIGGVESWFVVPTATGLVAFVPPGAASGNVVVTVDGVASNPVPITVN